MKLFLKRTILYILPLIIFILIVNISIDPGNLISGTETEIARYLKEGYNVTGNFNINERTLQKVVIQNLEESPSTIVLGSSRIMLIGRSFYGNNTLNNGVSGASLEDIIAIFQMYSEKKFYADKIVIGIDPWIFNQYNGQNRWVSLKEDYLSFFDKKTLVFDFPLLQYSQFLSPSYFQESIKLFIKLFDDKKKYSLHPTEHMVNDQFTRLNDGTISYDFNYRTISESDINERVQSFISGDIYSLERYDEISNELFGDFDLLISKLKEKKVDIELLLMPYHPMAYDYMISNSEYSALIEVEKLITEYGKDKHIKITGSYDPKEYKLNTKDFYDGMHMTPEGVRKVITTN